MTSPTDYVSEELRKGLAALQGSRVNTLSASRDLQVMMRALLQHEARRIEQKLGRQHPRSQRLHVRLQTSLDVLNTLEVERQLTQVQVPNVADQVAFIHGRVVDENRRGFAALVVCLVDGRTTPIREVEAAMTAPTGYYALTLESAVIDSIGKKYPTGVFLAVFTAKGRFVHRERQPLPLAAGLRLVVNVQLSRHELAQGKPPAPPCEPDPGEGQPPVPTVSVPDLIGRPEQEALAVLRRSDLQVGTRQQQPTTDQVGRVLAQEPKAGQEVSRGAPVNLVVGRRRPGVGERVMDRLERHPRFDQLGVSARELGEHLAGLSVESMEQAAALLDRPNPELRDALGLSSLRRTQAFKGILRQVLAAPE